MSLKFIVASRDAKSGMKTLFARPTKRIVVELKKRSL